MGVAGWAGGGAARGGGGEVNFGACDTTLVACAEEAARGPGAVETGVDAVLLEPRDVVVKADGEVVAVGVEAVRYEAIALSLPELVKDRLGFGAAPRVQGER